MIRNSRDSEKAETYDKEGLLRGSETEFADDILETGISKICQSSEIRRFSALIPLRAAYREN